MVPSSCPAMVDDLRHERARTGETIGRLRASQQVVEEMLDTALNRTA
ncbi:hypothetical protein [Nonomuraea sp. NPDC003727]